MSFVRCLCILLHSTSVWSITLGLRNPGEKNVTKLLYAEHASSLSFRAWQVLPDRVSNHISYQVPYHGLREQLITFPMRRPRVFNAIFATCKTWLADLVVQIAEASHRMATQSSKEGYRNMVDWKRSAAFALFGFVYVGVFQWILLVTIMTYACPHAIQFANQALSAKLSNVPGLIDLMKQVIIDNFVFAVFLYFPAFYSIKHLVSGGLKRSSVAEGLRAYWKNFFKDNAMNLACWVPGDMIAFAAPMFMRLPVDHTISFAWTMLLSFVRGRSSTHAALDEMPQHYTRTTSYGTSCDDAHATEASRGTAGGTPSER